MEAETDSKASKRSVSFPGAMLDEAAPRIARDYHGNLSAYVQTLVRRDLDGQMGAGGQDPLIAMAQTFHPGIAAELRSLCYSDDGKIPRIPQGKLISRLLEATALALRAQKETEKNLATAPRSAIQAELARLRQIEDAFFQIAATIVTYPEFPASRDLAAAEPSSSPERPGPVQRVIADEEQRRLAAEKARGGATPKTGNKS
jgi:Arc/MetJ-type ribon-helix-helix transcriptional regulator